MSYDKQNWYCIKFDIPKRKNVTAPEFIKTMNNFLQSIEDFNHSVARGIDETCMGGKEENKHKHKKDKSTKAVILGIKNNSRAFTNNTRFETFFDNVKERLKYNELIA